MPCQTQTSQQPQQPTTVLPQNLPKTQADWQRFLQRMNELLGSINNAQYATGVNAVPTEYAVYDGTGLPALRITGATSAFDTSHAQFGAGSLKLTATASTITVELAASGYPITLHPNWQWIASLFLLTSASTIAGKLSVVTPAQQYDVDISGSPGASWARLYGDYDLTADASTSCTLLLTLTGVTIGQALNLEGWMLEPSQGAVLPSPFIMTSGPRNWGQLVNDGNKPENGADVTATHTAADTAAVNGVAAATVQTSAIAANANTPAVINPQFANGTTSWSVPNAGWYEEAAGSTHQPDPIVPTYCVHAGSTVVSGSLSTDALPNVAHLPVVAGQQVSLACCVRELSVNAGALGYARISWRDSSNTEISTSSPTGSAQYPTCGAAGTGTYTQCVTKITAVAPAGAQYAVAELAVSGHTSGYFTFSNVVMGLIPSSVDEVPDGTNYGRTASNYLNANRPITDFADTFHRNKNLDNVGDGSNYGRPLLSRLNAGRPVIDFSESIHSNKTLDYMGDGSTYYRMPVANMDANRRALVDFSQSGHLNKNLDNLTDGSTYARVRAASLLGNSPTYSGMGRNLIANGSFEINTVATPGVNVSTAGAPICDNWKCGIGTGPWTMFVRQSNNAASYTKTGACAAQVTMNGGAIPASTTYYSDFFEYAGPLTLESNSTVLLRAQVYWNYNSGLGGCTGACGVQLGFYDSSGAILGLVQINQTSQGAKSVLSATGTVPAGTTKVRLLCQGYITNGTASTITLSGIPLELAVDDVELYVIANLDTDVNDGTTYARIYGSDLSGGKHRIGIAGSGYQIGDQRNLPAITFSNYGSGWNGMSLSYSSTTTSATVTASAATLQAGSVAISYNAASTTVTGSAGTSKTYYLYYTDATHSGGSQTLHASTSIITALNNDGNVYIASMSVTFPSSGSGGGSGGGGCPLRTAWVIRRGRHGGPQHVRAGKVRVGDWLLRSDGKWAEVTFSRPELQPCVRIVADGFGTLGCSISAPMQARDGAVLARDCLGRELVVQGSHAVVTDLRGLGDQWVQHITLANAPDDFFWTGDAKDALFAHHNMKPP